MNPPSPVPLRGRPWRIMAAVLLFGLAVAGLAPAAMYGWAKYRLAQARDEENRWHFAEAGRQVESALAWWPRLPEAELVAGRLARRQGDGKAAARHLERARQLQGDSEALTLERILIHAQTGQMDRWAGYLRSLVEQAHPQSSFILEAMARGYLQAYRLREAGLVLTTWRQQHPDNLQALLMAGWGLELSGNPELAADGS